MLDPKFIRENLELVAENCRQRRVEVDLVAWAKVDAERLQLLQSVEALRAERNSVADKMSSASAEERPHLIERGKSLKSEVAAQEERLATLEGEWKSFLLAIPNLTHPDSPIGATDEDNKELRVVGEIKTVTDPKDHVALCAKHDLVDFERATKVTGAKFYFLKRELAILELALIRFATDYLVKEGFIPMTTPDLAKDEVILGAGYIPRGQETQIYSIENSDLSLIGTSEITIGGYHKDEVLPEAQLPLKYAGISHCYRTEAGAYGRESYGLYRIHQFSKVEMFVFCLPEQAEAMHLEVLRHEEAIFKALEIPFRVIDICTGDLGGPAYRKYDLEAWMCGRDGGKGGWGEITSASNCTDYQARRLNVKCRRQDGVTCYAYTLNGTAISLARALVAFLENNQQEDGSIRIPKVLVPYCGFEQIG